MPPHHLLLLEPNTRLANDLKTTLESSGAFKVQRLKSAAGALATLRAASRLPAAVVLDRDLPDIPAYTLVRMLRERTRTVGLPLVVVGTDSTTRDRIDALKAGVDDFVTRPFTKELPVRLQAIIRRRVPPPLTETGRFVGTRITVDFDAIAVTADDATVELTRMEFELLRFFIHNQGRVLSRDQIVQNVWGKPANSGRVVDAVIVRLRSKLGGAGAQIETLHRSGYRFCDRPKSRKKEHSGSRPNDRTRRAVPRAKCTNARV